MFNMQEQEQAQEQRHIVLSLEIYEAMINFIGSKPYVETANLVPAILNDIEKNSKLFTLAYKSEAEQLAEVPQTVEPKLEVVEAQKE